MKDAKTLIETYFKTYPGIQKYITETIEEAHIKGYVTINGRKNTLNHWLFKYECSKGRRA